MIDSGLDDNRAYHYSRFSNSRRLEYPIISGWIKDNSRIIDFGCGDCSLIRLLKEEHNASCVGYDISETGIQRCRDNGVTAVCDAIDKEHSELCNQSFDYAICNVTLQMVMYPEVLFAEMRRVSNFQIISFPNFAYFWNRIDFFLKGKMPRPMLSGYTWYSTGHIHQLSVKDFYDFLKLFPDTEILDQHHLCGNMPMEKRLVNAFPNFLSQVSIILLK